MFRRRSEGGEEVTALLQLILLCMYYQVENRMKGIDFPLTRGNPKLESRIQEFKLSTLCPCWARSMLPRHCVRASSRLIAPRQSRSNPLFSNSSKYFIDSYDWPCSKAFFPRLKCQSRWFTTTARLPEDVSKTSIKTSITTPQLPSYPSATNNVFPIQPTLPPRTILDRLLPAWASPAKPYLLLTINQ